MNKKLYPVLKNEYVLVCRHIESMLYPLYINKQHYSTSSYPYLTLNQTGAEILSFCDGTNSVEHIIELMCSKYNESKEVATEFTIDFLNNSLEHKHIVLNSTKEKQDIRVCGDFSLVTPSFVSFEITKNCPLKCKHCFNDSGVAMANEMNTEQVYLALDKLREMGVQKVMITGGEPTQRKDFINIIRYASSQFIAVSIASSGYLITEKLAHDLAELKDNILVQISLDGAEKNHNEIRGVKNSFEKATKAIAFLSQCGIPVTIGATINDKNFNDMEEIAKVSQHFGAIELSFAITTEQGRARDNDLAHKIDVKDLVNRAIELREIYSNKGLIISIEDDTLSQLENNEAHYCGAGVSQMAIRANGDISPCVCFFYSYGNILSDELKDIFSPENVSPFTDIKIPCKAFCGDCPELENCNLCPARAFDSPLAYKDCKWKQDFSQSLINVGRGEEKRA